MFGFLSVILQYQLSIPDRSLVNVKGTLSEDVNVDMVAR
jgi:hypothetical protein